MVTNRVIQSAWVYGAVHPELNPLALMLAGVFGVAAALSLVTLARLLLDFVGSYELVNKMCGSAIIPNRHACNFLE